jgi:hypothetical protein
VQKVLDAMDHNASLCTMDVRLTGLAQVRAQIEKDAVAPEELTGVLCSHPPFSGSWQDTELALNEILRVNMQRAIRAP